MTTTNEKEHKHNYDLVQNLKYIHNVNTLQAFIICNTLNRLTVKANQVAIA